MPLVLPDGGTLALDGAPAFDAPLRVRLRRGGERIALPGRSHSHSLKHALQDAGLPPWSRECLPLLVDGDDTVLAAGDGLRGSRPSTPGCAATTRACSGPRRAAD